MAYAYRDDPILGPALSYWMEKRGGRAMPCKRDIDPTEISGKILPNLQLIDVIDGGARFRYRLIGTATVEAYGEDFTGRYPDEMFSAELRDFIHRVYRQVCAGRAPVFLSNRYVTKKGFELASKRIYMPLCDDSDAVSHIFGVLNFEYESAIADARWREGATLVPASAHVERVDIAPPLSAAAD
ncbi:MAG TPA: PAS domain-containing protein [Stellaceae bacterium]|nr:PAS domain-containing protein [Stellaceae bacterium]